MTPEQTPALASVTLELDADELARWTAAAAQDGAADLEQWIKVLVMARVNGLRHPTS